MRTTIGHSSELQSQQPWQYQQAVSAIQADPFWSTACRNDSRYPSPPMSDPPSPSRFPSGRPQPGTSSAYAPAVTSTAAVLASSAGLPESGRVAFAPLVSLPPIAQPYEQVTASSTSAIAPRSLPASTTSYEDQRSRPAIEGLFSTTRYELTSASQASSSLTSLAGPSSSRGGRKSKAHVASACINCKRAHLSCDVQRPCTRCIASGKQASLGPTEEGTVDC